jgi:hypothetical protein
VSEGGPANKLESMIRLQPAAALLSRTVYSGFQRALDRLFSEADRIGRYRWSLRIAFWLLLALVSIGVVLDYGALRREDVNSGPFRAAAREPDQYAVDIGAAVPAWLRIRLIDGSPFALPPSGVQLLQDGRAIKLPAQPRPQVSRSAKSSFGLRHRELTFALPSGVANDSRLNLSATYEITYHHTFADIVLTCFILIVVLGFIIGRHRLEEAFERLNKIALPPVARSESFLNRCAPLPMKLLNRFVALAGRFMNCYFPVALFLFPFLSMLVVAACLGYVVTIVYGVFAGHALPSATVFHLMPPDLLSGVEPYFPAAIIMFAAVGTLLAWAATFQLLPAEPIRHTEETLARIWAWWGLPVIVCLFLVSLSAGGWSGHIRVQDQNYMSFAGLAPHSDARAYFTDAYRAAFFRDWDVLGSRRPLGEAFRQWTVIGGRYSYVGTLLVQLCLVAVALFVAARLVAGRSGIWAGIAFVGLIYVLTRSFLYTTLTEPLGLIWTLFSIVFLLEAFRLNSLPHALVGFAGLTLALVTRMGSMFTIPILAVWIAYAFSTTWQERLRILALACGIMLAVLALNALLAFLYSSPLVATGSNFAYTFCGLSLGTDWSDCSRVYDAQLQRLPSERSAAAFLFATAWQNILEQPTVLLAKLADNIRSYFSRLPEFLLQGYSPGYQVSRAVAKLATLALLVSLFLVYRLRGTRIEGAFWTLVILSSAMSAAVILADDGWRTMHVTNALIACLAAAGFSAPTVRTPRVAAPPLRWQLGAGAIAVAAVLFVVGPTASRALMSGEASKYRSTGNVRTDESIVPGGRFITGFQVIPDGSSRPLHVPTLFVSEFTKLAHMINIESDFGPFIDLAVRRVPFALVVTGRFDNANQSNIFIAPVTVLERQDVAAWRFQVRQAPPGGADWNSLQEAVAAEPVP